MKKAKDSKFVREASPTIFSTAGLLGRSVTEASSNRTKSVLKACAGGYSVASTHWYGL